MIKQADKEVSPWYMKAGIKVAKKFLLREKK